MNLSLEFLERSSAVEGFRIEALEKVALLGEMAANISRHPLLGSVLALKGGTALNLCFGPPKRLSVDLDYNYIGHAEREKMLAERPAVEEAVADLARRLGYRLQRSSDAFAGRKLFLHYRSILGGRERIEIDLNFLFRVPFSGTYMRSLWQPGDLDRPRIKVVGREELLAGKLLAFLDRGAVRDVWDVAHLTSPNAKVVRSTSFRSRFIALSAMLDHPLPTYSRSRLYIRITDRVVSEQLVPMLAMESAISTADLLECAWKAVSHLMSLTSAEHEYLEAIQQGDLRTDLLFLDNPSEAVLFANHPVILWKIVNVRSGAKRT